jgi:peptide/nickel transport system permease protein
MRMLAYLIKRLLWAVLVLLGLSLVSFTIISLVPGDPAKALAGPQTPPTVLAEIRHGWGLDRPLPLRYLGYLGHLARGDLGRSYIQDEDVLTAILSRLPQTVQLAIAGIVCELLVAFPLGIVAAARAGGLLDRTLLAITAVSISTPTFLVCLLLLLSLGSWLHLLPLGGYGDPWPKYVLLPALAIGLPGGAWYSRLLRTALLETRRLEFVRTARAKGASRRRIMLRHIMPIALLPLLPIIGTDLANLLGGVVIVESVVNWPGIGLQAYTALKTLDTPLVMGTVLLAGLFVVGLNLMVDLAVAALDPRVRLG